MVRIRAGLRAAEKTVLAVASEDSNGGVDTPEERYALYRELEEDPAVKRLKVADMFKVIEDPEMLKARRAQRAMRLEQDYADLLNKLDYTDEQSQALIKLLLDNERAAQASYRALRQAASKSEITVEERRLRRKNLRDEQDARVADLLGSDFQEYRDYRDTLQERQSLNFYASSFREPLDDYTKEALIRIMYEEQKAVAWPPPASSRDLESLVVHSRKMLVARTTKYQRVIERATSYLTDQQLKDLGKSLEADRTMLEMGLKMEEIQLRDQKQQAGP